jgi:hypothetical protein
MLIGCVYQGQPIDKILMADTGAERPATYTFQSKMSRWMEAHGYDPITVVRHTDGDGNVETLEERCLEQEMLPSLAYGFQRKACSVRHKQQPQEEYARAWEPACQAWDRGERVIKLIGFDVGETRRYSRQDNDDRYIYEYPLVDWQWDRTDCERVIVHAGLCLPPKSSCFFCPSMKPEEIRQLKRRHPDLYRRAIEIEKAGQKTLQEDSSIEGLGGSWSWQELMEKDEDQLEAIPRSRTADCRCYDGGRPEDEDLNEYVAEEIDMEDKDLPFAIGRAGDLDEERKARRSGGGSDGDSGDSPVDVTVEEVQATLPGLGDEGDQTADNGSAGGPETGDGESNGPALC